MPEEAGRAEEHIITDAAPNDLKIGEGAQSDETGPSIRRSRPGVFVGRRLRKLPGMFGSSEETDTHTTTHTKPHVEYPSGKPLEAKISNEFGFNICSGSSNQGASVKKQRQKAFTNILL